MRLKIVASIASIIASALFGSCIGGLFPGCTPREPEAIQFTPKKADCGDPALTVVLVTYKGTSVSSLAMDTIVKPMISEPDTQRMIFGAVGKEVFFHQWDPCPIPGQTRQVFVITTALDLLTFDEIRRITEVLDHKAQQMEYTSGIPL